MCELMECGHIANAVTSDNKPVCVICNCTKINNNDNINLSNRQAKCCYCNRIVESDIKLPFFKHKPNQQYDEYYCGCGGWD